MNIRLNSKVQKVDPSLPTVTLESGETLKADLIIGADGLNSRLRDIVVGHPDKPTPTGDGAYRALIPTGLMKKDPDLRQLVDEGSVNVWMGPGRHIVSYCVVSSSLSSLKEFRPDNITAKQERIQPRHDPPLQRYQRDSQARRYCHHEIGFHWF